MNRMSGADLSQDVSVGLRLGFENTQAIDSLVSHILHCTNSTSTQRIHEGNKDLTIVDSSKVTSSFKSRSLKKKAPRLWNSLDFKSTDLISTNGTVSVSKMTTDSNVENTKEINFMPYLSNLERYFPEMEGVTLTKEISKGGKDATNFVDLAIWMIPFIFSGVRSFSRCIICRGRSVFKDLNVNIKLLSSRKCSVELDKVTTRPSPL
ncbi:hypothetical protein WICPIJ_002779 [Wickerhamomyces pijperi]|uniref:Uncharacterized protein n=1 Tax=Wickerhamomyces pijperi TaxID=599730 RepID=A0A9P8Q954_WICPI|nr:hypothetical protein WICPIJ_002779 [Wickerhamomyces pijperi]